MHKFNINLVKSFLTSINFLTRFTFRYRYFLIDYIKRFLNNEKWKKAEITNEHKEVFDLVKEYINQSKKTYRYNNPISRDKSNDVNGDLGYIDGVNQANDFINSFNINNATVNNFKNRQYWTGMWHVDTFGFQLESDNKIIEVYAYHNWTLKVTICFFEKEEDIKDIVDIERLHIFYVIFLAKYRFFGYGYAIFHNYLINVIIYSVNKNQYLRICNE